MKRAQASLEYLLLTAGVILVGVIASQAVVTSSTSTSHQISAELNVAKPVDKVPPTTAPLCDRKTCYSDYNTAVQLGFLCQGNLGGSGCAKTYYAIVQKDISTNTETNYAHGVCDQAAGNCANVVTLKAPPAGDVYEYEISFFSEDLNGNQETPRTATIWIGTPLRPRRNSSAPPCSISFTPLFPRPGEALEVNVLASSVLYDGKIHIYSAAAGLDKNISCGTGPKCNGSVLLPASPDAYTVTIEVLGKDKFGNRGTCGSETVNVDGKNPTVTFNSPDVCKWQNSDFTVSVTGADPTPSSGLGAWEHMVDDGIPPEYTSGLKTIAGGPTSQPESFTVTVGKGKECERQGISTCAVTAEFQDRAGNRGSKTEKFSIDYNAPSVSASPTLVTWTTQPINIKLSCSDNNSGCEKIYWAFVPAGSSCPTNISDYNVSTLCNPSGCPASCPKTASTTITLNCPACKVDLCLKAEDAAGNISEANVIRADDGAYQIDQLKSESVTLENIAIGTSYWLNGGVIFFNSAGEAVCDQSSSDFFSNPGEYPACCAPADYTYLSPGVPWTTQAAFYVPDLDTKIYGWPKPDSVKKYPYVYLIKLSVPSNESPIKSISVRLGKYPYSTVSVGPNSEYPYTISVDPDAAGSCTLKCWVGSDTSSGFSENLCPTNPRFEVDTTAVEESGTYDSGKGYFIELENPSRNVQILCTVDVPIGSACYANAIYVGTEDLAGNLAFPAIKKNTVAIDNTYGGSVSVNVEKIPSTPVCQGTAAPNGDACSSGWLRALDVSVTYSGFSQISGAPGIGGGYVEILTSKKMYGNISGTLLREGSPKYSRAHITLNIDPTKWVGVISFAKSVGNERLGPIEVSPGNVTTFLGTQEAQPAVLGETDVLVVPYAATGVQRGASQTIRRYCYDGNAPQIISATFDKQIICSNTNNGEIPDKIVVTVHAWDAGTGVKEIKIVSDENPDVVLASKTYSCGSDDVTATFTITAKSLLQLKYKSTDKITNTSIDVGALKTIVCDQVGNCTAEYPWKEGTIYNHGSPWPITVLNAAKYAVCWNQSESYEQAVCAANEDKCAATPLSGWDTLGSTSNPKETFVSGYCSTDATTAYKKYDLSCSSGEALVQPTAYILASDGKPRCNTASSDTIIKTTDCSTSGELCCAGECYDPSKATCCSAEWDDQRATWYNAKIAYTSSGEFCCMNSSESIINVCTSDQCCDNGTCMSAADYCGTPTAEECKNAGCSGSCTYVCKSDSCQIECT